MTRFMVLCVLALAWSTIEINGIRLGDYSRSVNFPLPSSSTQFPRVVFDISLPSLDEFTLCCWMKLTSLSDREFVFFSYAVGSGTDSDEIMASVNRTTSTTELKIKVANNLARLSCEAFTVGTFHKVCITWASVRGRVQFYVDENLCSSEVNGIATGTRVRSGGTIVLGQDQDTVGGTFSSNEAFVGGLTQLNFFDEVLDQDQIRRASTCLSKAFKYSPCCYQEDEISGNIIGWSRTLFSTFDTVQVYSSVVCK
ncbi:C-reactive protein 3.3-like [Tachypleus tridentatus]|uniref:C-reactive protein 3.3-like n=1 Tax=Tachypleus tridentatus TaxID=6853 RepID=UPI003FD4FAF3